MSSLPTGTVTFLFTDIEGSTKLSQEHRDTWEAVRGRHHAILHAAMELHGGHVFQIVGDGFCVAFDAAAEALDAAVEAQRRLQAEDWGETPIRVRMGIHTGAAQAGSNADGSGGYTGYAALVRTQRLTSSAHGGQVLLSQSVYELVQSDVPEDVLLRDLGQHRLKDLLRAQHLYQVVVADLPSEFPPLRTLELRPHNLPVQLTSFVGREAEMRELGDLLGRTRLVTLTGVGGTGKTRLALQVAADALYKFPDGAWLTELAPLSDPALVPQAIAMALNVREQPGRTFIDVLKDYLANKHLLLLLDNCEHLIDASAQAADALLHASPRSRIIATSREALGIAGEAGFPVRSLSLPAASAVATSSVAQYDAVRLFIDRAVAVQPGFQVTDHNASAVAQICTRLDGIPLAIELAAARVGALSVGQIASRLDDRFRLLTGGSRTALPRQRTLQATIDWSYNLLSEAERMLMRRLSVFAGGWTLEAAESVCCEEGVKAHDVLDLMSHLVAKSLVIADEQDGVMRYRILETIRQYAQERLVESGEAEAIRRRHIGYFAALAEQFEMHTLAENQTDWFRRIRSERDNYRAALDWCMGAGETGLALKLVGRFGEFWRHFIPINEGRERLERILAAAPEPSAERAQAVWQLGTAAATQGDASTVSMLAEELWTYSEILGGPYMMARAYMARSWPLYAAGDDEKALPLMQRSLELYEQAGHPEDAASALLMMGEMARVKRDWVRAREFDEQALPLLRSLNYRLDLASDLANLATLLIHFNELERSEALLRESWSVAIETGSINYPYVLLEFGYLANARGQAVKAARLMGAGSALLTVEGRAIDPADRPDYDDNLASLHTQLDQAAFKQAWDEGAAMTKEQAIAYALEQVPQSDDKS